MARQYGLKTSDRLEAERTDIRPGFPSRAKVVLVFPDEYRVGMSNLGFQLVYRFFNDIPGVSCHRAFFPERTDLERIRTGRDIIRSLETGEPLSNYDLVAFSMNYENHAMNMVEILHRGGIPVRAADRTGSDPMVVCGGVIATVNPEPLADFVDFFIVGEAEEIVPEFMEVFIHSFAKHRDRRDALESLIHLPGVYVPECYDISYNENNCVAAATPNTAIAPVSIAKRVTPDLDRYPGSSQIHTPDSEFSGLHLVEVTRGCPQNCRFCLIQNCYNPFRIRSRQRLLQEIDGALPDHRIGLLGAGIADYPDLEALCLDIAHTGRTFSFSSMHASEISENLAELIFAAGPRTVTLAPETGLEHRRGKIGKTISDNILFTAIERIGRPPINTIKLYFMIGLPGETLADIDAIPGLCRQVQHLLRKVNRSSRRIPRLAVSISCFVPKAQTAFQRAPMDPERVLADKLKRLKQSFRETREIHVFHDVPKWAVIQGLLARGDRRIGELISRAVVTQESWKRIFATCPINPGFYLHRIRNLSETMPWDHLTR